MYLISAAVSQAGIGHYRTGGIIQAERFGGYAITAAKQAEANDLTCIALSNMALVQYHQKNIVKAVECATESLQLASILYSKQSDEVLIYIYIMYTGISIM
jgi:hypothetical protein